MASLKAKSALVPTASPYPPLKVNVRKRWRDELTLAIGTADRERYDGIFQVALRTRPGEPTIEAGQSLSLSSGKIGTERWSNGFEPKTFYPETATIIPYVPRMSPTIEGLDWATCRRLADSKLGADFFL